MQAFHLLVTLLLLMTPVLTATTSVVCVSTVTLIVPTPGSLYVVDNCGVTGDIVFTAQSLNTSLRITNSTVRGVTFQGNAVDVSVSMVDSRMSGGQLLFSQDVVSSTVSIVNTTFDLIYPSGTQQLSASEQQFIVCKNSNATVRDVHITLTKSSVYFGFDNVSLFMWYNGYVMNTASGLLHIEVAVADRVKIVLDRYSVVNHTLSQGRTISINSPLSGNLTVELNNATVQTPCLVSLSTSSSNNMTTSAVVSVAQSYVGLSSLQEVSSIVRVDGNGTGGVGVSVNLFDSTVVGLVLAQGLGLQKWFLFSCLTKVLASSSVVSVEASGTAVLGMTGLVTVAAVREGSISVILTSVTVSLITDGVSQSAVLGVLNQTPSSTFVAFSAFLLNCVVTADAIIALWPYNGSLVSNSRGGDAPLKLRLTVAGSNVSLQYALCDLRLWSPLFLSPLLSVDVLVNNFTQLTVVTAAPTATFGSSLVAVGGAKLIESTVIIAGSSLYNDSQGIVNSTVQRQGIVATLGDAANLTVVISNKALVRLQRGFIVLVGMSSNGSTVSVTSEARAIGIVALLFVGGNSTDDSIELRDKGRADGIAPLGGSLMSLGCASCYVVSPSILIANGSSFSIAGLFGSLERDVLLLRLAANATAIFPSVVFYNVVLVSAFDAAKGIFDWRPMGNASNIWSAQFVWRRANISTVVVVEAPAVQKTLFVVSTRGHQGETLVTIDDTLWVVTSNSTARPGGFNMTLVEMGPSASLNVAVTSIVVNVSRSTYLNAALAVVSPCDDDVASATSSKTLRLAMTNMDLGGPNANYTLTNAISAPALAAVTVDIDAVTLNVSGTFILLRLQEGSIQCTVSVRRSRIVGNGNAALLKLLRGSRPTAAVTLRVECQLTDVVGVIVLDVSNDSNDSVVPLRIAVGTVTFDQSALRNSSIGRMRDVADSNISVVVFNSSVAAPVTDFFLVGENAVNTVLSLMIQGASTVTLFLGLVGLFGTANASLTVAISGGSVSCSGGGGLLYLSNATGTHGGLAIFGGQSVTLPNGPLLLMANTSSLRAVLQSAAVVVAGGSQVTAKSVAALSSVSVLSSIEVGGYSRVALTSGCLLDMAGNSTVNRTEIGTSWVTLAASPGGGGGVVCGSQMSVPALPMVVTLNHTSLVVFGEGRLVSTSTPTAVAQMLQFTLCHTLLNGSDWRRDARLSIMGTVVTTCATRTPTNSRQWTTQSYSASNNRWHSPLGSPSLSTTVSPSDSSASVSTSLSISHSVDESVTARWLARPSCSLSLSSVPGSPNSATAASASLSISRLSASVSPTRSRDSDSPSTSLSLQLAVAPPLPTTPVPTSFVSANTTLSMTVNGTMSATLIAFALESAFGLSVLPTVVIVSDSGTNRTILVMFTDPWSRDRALIELNNATSTEAKPLRTFVLSATAVYPVLSSTAAPAEPTAGSMSAGSVAAIVLGVIILVGAGCVVAFYCWRKRSTTTAKSIADIEMMDDSLAVAPRGDYKDTPAVLLQDDPMLPEAKVEPDPPPQSERKAKKKKALSPAEVAAPRISLPAEGAEHIPDWVPLDEPMIVAADECVEDENGFYDEEGYYHYYLKD